IVRGSAAKIVDLHARGQRHVTWTMFFFFYARNIRLIPLPAVGADSRRLYRAGVGPQVLVFIARGQLQSERCLMYGDVFLDPPVQFGEVFVALNVELESDDGARRGGG